jgi:hypothetical protein
VPTAAPAPIVPVLAAPGFVLDPGAHVGYLLAGNGTYVADVVITDPVRHTRSALRTVYAIPTYSIFVEARPPFGLRLYVSVEHGLSASNVTLLVYPDEGLSQRAYAVRSPNTTACVYVAENVTTVCRTARIGVSAATPVAPVATTGGAAVLQATWVIDLLATPESYFSGDVVARVHVRGADIEGREVVLRLSPTQPTSSPVVVASTGPGGTPLEPYRHPKSGVPSTAPDGSPISPKLDPSQPPPSAPGGAPGSVIATTNPADVPRNGQSFGTAVLRGVFALTPSDDCTGNAVQPVSLIILLFIVAAIGRTAYSLYRRRTVAQAEDQTRTEDAPTAAALLRDHAYIGAVWPCHHFCGVTHAAQLFVHVLMLYLACALLLASQESLVYSTAAGAATSADSAWLALLAALVVALLQPVFTAPYSLNRVIDERPVVGMLCGSVADKQDLTKFGFARHAFVGVSRRTDHGIDRITYEACGAEYTTSMAALALTLRERTAPAPLSPPNESFSSTSNAMPPAENLDEPTTARAVTAAGGQLRAASLDKTTDTPSPNHNEENGAAPTAAPANDATASSTHDSHADTVTAMRLAGVACSHRNAAECVQVEYALYQWLGHLVCAVGAIACVLSIADVTGSWCEAHYNAHWPIFGIAIALDVSLAQPLFMMGVLLWRWLLYTEDEDPDHQTAPEHRCLAHVRLDLHPIHGQWRFVGRNEVIQDWEEDF